MTEPAFITVTIGGTELSVAPLRFAALKKAWPDIQLLPTTLDLVKQTTHAVAIISAAIMQQTPSYTPEFIESALTCDEMFGIVSKVNDLLQISGLVPKEAPKATASGEATAAGSTSNGVSLTS